MITHLHHMLKELEEDFVQGELKNEYDVIEKELENKRSFLKHLTAGKGQYFKIRDQIMAGNLEWICNELYPNEKIIIWAHNNHIFKNISGSYRPMGSLMSQELESQSYYLGFFMYHGEVTFDKKSYEKLSKPAKKSLEDYMNHHPAPISFLDFSRKSPNEDNKWIFRKTVILNSGMMPTLIVPKEQLDGIFFVKEVSPPNYL